MNIILWSDIIKYPLTGIGRYTFEIASGLKKNKNINALYYYNNKVSNTIPSTFEPPSSIFTNFKKSIKSHAVSYSTALMLHRRYQSYQQSRVLSKYNDAILHGPNFYLPEYSGPCVATFHDLSVIHHPEFHPKERVRYMLDCFPFSLNRANILITISEHARNELIDYSGFPENRVICTPLAASSEFYPRTESQCKLTLTKYNLKYHGYCLFVGTIEPRKNIANLISAYGRLPYKLRIRYPLVLVGYYGWRSERLHQLISSAQVEGWLKYIGFVDSNDLPILYSAAKSFLFPSFYEGFGLPILEAMSSGIPVVCSNASSLPEVAGNNALMCEPEDVFCLTELIDKSLNDDEWRDFSITNGKLHASGFTWEKVIAATESAYELSTRF